MSNAVDHFNEEAELLHSIEKHETRAVWGGAFVLLGLVVETGLAFAFPNEKSKILDWGTLFADASVALGVFCEILFAQKARSKSEDLRVLSNEKVAAANRIAAQANERAEALSKEAAEARERTAEIERLTAFRHVSPEQRQQIVDVVRHNTASLLVLIEHQQSDIESYSYAFELAKLFLDAGIEELRLNANAYLSGNVFGLWMTATRGTVATNVIDAFLNAQVPMRIAPEKDLSTHLPRNEVPPNLYIFVGPKIPPTFSVRADGVVSRESNI